MTRVMWMTRLEHPDGFFRYRIIPGNKEHYDELESYINTRKSEERKYGGKHSFLVKRVKEGAKGYRLWKGNITEGIPRSFKFYDIKVKDQDEIIRMKMSLSFHIDVWD